MEGSFYSSFDPSVTQKGCSDPRQRSKHFTSNGQVQSQHSQGDGRLCTLSCQSNVDSLILESDWSDLSFYSLPSIKKRPLPSQKVCKAYHVSNITAELKENTGSACLTAKQQRNLTLNPKHSRLHRNNYKNHRKSAPKQFKIPVQSRTERSRLKMDYSTNHISPNSDDSISRSSSGIASDLDCPISKTPRGLSLDCLHNDSSTGMKALFTDNPPKFHSNVDIDSLLMGVYTDKQYSYKRGDPHSNTRPSQQEQQSFGSHLMFESRNLFDYKVCQSNTAIPLTSAFCLDTESQPNLVYTGTPERALRKDQPFVKEIGDTEKFNVKNKVLNDDMRSNKLEYSLMKRNGHSMNDYSSLNSSSLLNTFLMEPPQHVSSSVWAMKLLETESTPSTNQELVLKSKLFRCWRQRARLLRFDRIENNNKMKKAVKFWQNCTLNKHFNAWKRNRLEKESKADSIYHRHMLGIGLRGLQYAVQASSKASSEALKRVDNRLLAKYWIKWHSRLAEKKSENLRSAFSRWRIVHLEGNRDRVLGGIADRHIMAKSYTKWKIRYSVEQNNSIAGLNFQIRLITKCWHSWRIYVAQRIVKTRFDEVARIQYENHLQWHVFKVWMERHKRCSVASNLLKRKITVKAFYSWRNWTLYAKVIHQRFQSMCKEYHNRSLLRQSFINWKRNLMAQQAVKYHSQLLKTRVYRLWFLRYKRKVIHRRLCKALAKKGKKKRFLRIWVNAIRSQQKRRQAFIGIFHKLLLTKAMLSWKNFTIMKTSLKWRLEFIIHKKEIHKTRCFMGKWMLAMKIANLKQKAKANWTTRCVKSACITWKCLLKRKVLEKVLIETRPERDLLSIKAYWTKWRKRKEIVDEENDYVSSVAAILSRNFKRRVFIAWRVTNQQEQIIAPTVERRDRKLLARVFDCWRIHIHRQKYIVDQKTRASEKLLDKHFIYWRERAFLQFKGRYACDKIQFSKMSRAFFAWKGHIREIRHKKLKQRAEKLQILSLYFKKWTQNYEEVVEAKELLRAKQARKVLLVRWVLKYWQNVSEAKRDQLEGIEEEVKTRLKCLKVKQCMDVWVRWYKVAEIVRTHQLTRQQQLMMKIFHAWSGVIKEELNAQLSRFSTNLALDCSLGSTGGSQFFRSGTLDSNGGSLLRSTLDSNHGSSIRSTMDSLSDYLSSGYWTTRRGSGSMFPFRSIGVSQRDDDVASLPGRLDHIQCPDSPRFRSASPITLIRESNNVGHTIPPLVTGQSPNTSPSPSPPELHLSLASSTDLTDTVFTPIKDSPVRDIPIRERIGSGISFRQEFERRQSSMDDEEMFDSMSMTSGLSTASVRDRELVVIDTIRHWLHLSLSKTFRSWLKYTRQRKLLRELLYFAKEKKSQQIITLTFKKWRRELYITVACRQFLLNNKRLQCLRAWHGYTEHRQLRSKSFKSAESMKRILSLKRYFTTWKEKYTAKIRLQAIVGQWQKKAIVTEKHKAIGDKILSQHNKQHLRLRFTYWFSITQKCQEAKQIYLERLLPRTFLAWHHYSSTHVSNCRKSIWFKNHRLLTLAFGEWKKLFKAQQKVSHLIESKEFELSVNILKTWHLWASGVCTRRRLWRSHLKSLKIKAKKNIFDVWRDQVKRREAAVRMFTQNLMRSVLLAWRDVSNSYRLNKDKETALKKFCANNVLKRVFNFWLQLLTHTQLATSYLLQQDSALVKECFHEWRDFTMTAKAEKCHNKYITKLVYRQWFDNCRARKKARQFIRSWKIIAEDSKVLNSKALEVCQVSDKKNLHKSFIVWIQATHKIQKAKNYNTDTILKSSLKAWYKYAHSRESCRKLLLQVERAKVNGLLQESFMKWKCNFERQVFIQDVLDNHLLSRQDQQLKFCMLKWRKLTLKCRSEKHHDSRLIVKCFSEWKVRFSQKKGLKTIMEKVFYRRIRQAAMHWKQFTARSKHQQCRAQEFQDITRDNLMQSAFVFWVETTNKSKNAAVFYEKNVLERAFKAWTLYIKNTFLVRRKVENFQNSVMEKKIRQMFKKWQFAYTQNQKYNKLVNLQLLKRNALILGGCIRQWKKDMLKCRAAKHYNILLNARFFLEWKIRFEDRLEEKGKEQVKEENAVRSYHMRLSRFCFRHWLQDVRVEKHLEMKLQKLVGKHFRLWQKKANLRSIASVRGDQQVCSKYWCKWRNQLIRKRVSELMVKHEEKKLLSEVFGAWYKITMIERRLLSEWNIALTEKWFRQWMQKYNES